MSTTRSWVIKEKATGAIVLETFNAKVVDALNTVKYHAVPIQEHLAGLNKSLTGLDYTCVRNQLHPCNQVA